MGYLVRATIAFQTDKSINAYGPLAAKVEEYGFDGVSVYNDMLYQPPWLPLLEMARATSRIRLGPAAANPFTCHPIHLAGNLALLDEASEGRAYLGLARGAWLDFVGLHPKQGVAALRETFLAVRHLLKKDPAPLEGTFFPLAGGDSLRWDIPHAEIPMILGTWGPKTVRACLPFAEEVKVGGTANPAAVRWMRELCLEADPEREAPAGVAVGAVTVVDEDGDAARALARREVALYLPVVANLDPTLDLDPERIGKIKDAAGRFDFEDAARFISDELLSKFAFAGTPGEVAAQVASVAEAGASRIEFGTPHGLTTEAGLRLLGEQVLPALKQL